MAESKDDLSRDQSERFARQGIQAEETTSFLQSLFGWRSMGVKLKDGRTGNSVQDAVSKAADGAVKNALSKSPPKR